MLTPPVPTDCGTERRADSVTVGDPQLYQATHTHTLTPRPPASQGLRRRLNDLLTAHPLRRRQCDPLAAAKEGRPVRALATRRYVGGCVGVGAVKRSQRERESHARRTPRILHETPLLRAATDRSEQREGACFCPLHFVPNQRPCRRGLIEQTATDTRLDVSLTLSSSSARAL